MSKRSNKFDRYSRKQELRLIRIIFTKAERDAKSRPRPIQPSYIPPDLIWAVEDCDVCGNQTVYHRQYDWRICPWCNEGKDSGCDDPDCGFCRNRPERPLTDTEWERWKRGELTARTIKPGGKVKRRRLKTNRKKKQRPIEKRGLKYRNPIWRRSKRV